MFSLESTWSKIDAVEDYMYYRDCHGDVYDSLKDALGKLYLLAWLQACIDRDDEELLARLAAALSWQAIPSRIRAQLFTNLGEQVERASDDIEYN